MLTQVKNAFLTLILMTLLTGVAYPVLVTVAARAFFPHQAGGSFIQQRDRVVGSSLIGQSFDDPKYFWGRPSATTPPYNAANSGGSNLGPLNPELRKSVTERVDRLKKADPANRALIPVDLVTASASGLDPHISPAAAYYQLPRVARARGLKETEVKQLVDHHIEPRQWGVLGEACVNVLKLNLALDELKR